MRKLSLGLRSAIASLALVAVAAVPAANAATIIAQGTNFEIVNYCDGDPVGDVVIRWDIVAPGSINNSIYSVTPAAGWTYAVKKAGGINQPIEVDFVNGKLRAQYRSLVEPGRTAVNCPIPR